MANMRIGTRLLLAFGAIVLLTIFLGLYALAKDNQLQALTRELDSRDFESTDALLGISRTEDQMRAARAEALVSALLRRDNLAAQTPGVPEQDWTKYRDQMTGQLADLNAMATNWQATSLTAERAAAWRRVHSTVQEAAAALKALSPEVERQYGLMNAGNITAAVGSIPTIEQAVNTLQARLADARQAVADQTRIGRTEVADLAATTRNSVIFVLITTVVAGVLFAVFIQRSITIPLSQFVQVVERVGQGDLTQKLEFSRRDELGKLGRSLDGMVRGLREVANQTRSVAESLNAATTEIFATTQQQAASTAEQAAAVQEANATMAEIVQSGVQITDRAKKVAASAEATSTSSAAGIESVQNTAAIMESIREQAEAVAENVVALSEKTQAISEIITTVNDIAEQSHLLALNAAIQAAAAGEHGRSFAVVASEMRNLAAQSKQATVQVRSILGDIQKAISSSVMLTEEAVKRVETGRQQANVADRTIRDLTGNIEESVRAFQQIVGGSSQQQIGFEQVTEAFRNIGIASQEAATGTKQSEKAAANLNALSQQLRRAMEKYRV
ncbi:MAG TPA: methyl-accepting chemotaxis protein [Bryobacteraceae bacterium]|nr:methyl-accepting chemotaxis protein [Bryobacteraceae bacterium]